MPPYEGRKVYRRGGYRVHVVPDTVYWYVIENPAGKTVAHEDHRYRSHRLVLLEAEAKIKRLGRWGA
jgi:hypothetical protein